MARGPQDVAAALRYGPQTAGLMHRSAYLEDALRNMQQSGGENIRSPWELGAKLVATALLSRASNKAQDATLGAIKADQDAETQKLLASFPTSRPALPSSAPALPAMAPPVPDPVPAQALPQAPPQSQTAHSPQDRDALIRMVVTEAGGEGPEGMAAAAHVALNRLRTGYQGAKNLTQVVNAPYQFEGMSRAAQVKPDDYQRAGQIVDAILGGQSQDPTNGAINFLNPELQVKMGRAIPAWAQGQGQRIGRHVFFGGGRPQQMAAQSVPPPPPPPDPGGPPVQGDAMPYEVAALGSSPLPPSAPGSSPPAMGAPPAAVPQAVAGGNPEQKWPTWQPTAEQVDWVSGLLSNPRTHDQGVVEARKLQAKMAEPAPAKIVQIGELQFYVPETPGVNVAPVMIPVPREAMTRQVSAQTINPAAPAGMQAQVSPLGNVKEGIGSPPENMQAVRENGQLRYVPIQGSKEDPYRVQAPGPGYQYTPSGSQQAIPGSSADTKNPANVMDAANRYGGMIKTIVDSAMKVRQNFGAVQTGYRQQNGTGDIAMINGLQKLIDEGVVKGEDVTMQMKSNGLQGTLGSYSQYLSSGGLLTPDVRNKVLKTGNDLYANLDRTYRSRVTSLQPGFDEAYGAGAFGKYVFPDAFAAEMGWTGNPTAPNPMQPPAPQPATYTPAINQAHANMVARGEYDAKAPLGSAKRPALLADEAQVRAFDVPANKGKVFIGPDGRKGTIQ